MLISCHCQHCKALLFPRVFSCKQRYIKYQTFAFYLCKLSVLGNHFVVFHNESTHGTVLLCVSYSPRQLLLCDDVRSCCVLIASSGTQMQTCLATSAAQRLVVVSCSCSGTSTKLRSCWHLSLVKQLLSWRTLVTT